VLRRNRRTPSADGKNQETTEQHPSVGSKRNLGVDTGALHPASMNTRDDFNRSGFAFLMSDIDLALTMTQIALSAPSNSAKRTRNTNNARHAYDTVLHFRTLVTFSDSEQEQFIINLGRLKSALMQLGEEF